MKRLLVVSLLLCFSGSVYAARIVPGPSGITAFQRTHQVQVRIDPVPGPDGVASLRVTLGYSRSAAAAGIDQLIVALAGGSTNKVLLRVVDPRMRAAARYQAMAKDHLSALATAYAPLDEFTHTVIVPVTAGVDEHLYIAARRGNGVLVLARTKADLTRSLAFTARTSDPVDDDGGGAGSIRPGRVHSLSTSYCYESDWCQEVCIVCDSEPCWDSWNCSVACLDPPPGGGGGGGGGGENCWFWDDCEDEDGWF